MSSTRHTQDCCCEKKVCGYCNQSNIGNNQEDEWALNYCMDGLEKRPSEEYIQGGYDPDSDYWVPPNPDYGASCADTELLQITFGEYRFAFVGTDPDPDSPCVLEDAVQSFEKPLNIPIYRTIYDPCAWKCDCSVDNPIVVQAGLHMTDTRKICYKTHCCAGDSGASHHAFNTDVISSNFEIWDVELRVSAACVDSELLAQRWEKPIGTCGRVVELKVKIRFSDQFDDDPDCVPQLDCFTHFDILQDNVCNRGGLLPSGAPLAPQVYNFRGGTYYNGWFFTSCGCMPYCWVDDDACSCGDYVDDGDKLGSFKKLDTPQLSTDVQGRDRLCNAKDCGCRGCIVARRDGDSEANPFCVEEKYNYGTGGYEEYMCEGTGKWYSGHTDRCGRGMTYSTEMDSGVFTSGLGYSIAKIQNTTDFPCPYEYDVSWRNICCMGETTLPAAWVGGNCDTQIPGSTWSSQPFNNPTERFPDRRAVQTFNMSWRIIPA